MKVRHSLEFEKASSNSNLPKEVNSEKLHGAEVTISAASAGITVV